MKLNTIFLVIRYTAQIWIAELQLYIDLMADTDNAVKAVQILGRR